MSSINLKEQKIITLLIIIIELNKKGKVLLNLNELDCKVGSIY
jgi:hypothetical protein